MKALPTVHLADFHHPDPAVRARFVQRFGDGFREYGFAVVDGHGIPAEAIADAFGWAERLFALPVDRKRRYLRPEIGRARGYTEFGRERAVGAGTHDLKEFWHVGQEASDAAGPPVGGASHPAQRYPENAWPDEAGLEGFRPFMTSLYGAFEARALVLLRALALYLGQPEEHFAQMAGGGNSVLRLIHYPPIASDAPADAVRAAAHEDINLITLLCEGTSGGLEVALRDGTWLPVESLKGQLVINAGDMLTRCSGGIIPATTHRVMRPRDTSKPRYSIPFFTHPRPEVLLAPPVGLPGQATADTPAISAYDFLVERLRANGVYDADPLAQVT